MTNLQKRIKSVFAFLLAAALLCAGPLTDLRANAVTQADIDELRSQLEELDKQAEAQQQVINELTENQGRVVDRKMAIDAKVALIQQQVTLLNEQVALYDELIAEKEAELKLAQEAEATQTELLRSRIRAMEENGNYTYLSFLFEASSFPDLLSRLADVSDIMHYDQNLEADYIAARENVESIKHSYEEYQLQQEELIQELDAKKAEMNAMTTAAAEMIASIDSMTENAQAEYDAIAELYAEADQRLDELVRKQAEEEEARRRAAEEEARRQQEEQGGDSTGSTGGSTGGNTGGSTGGSAVSLSSLMWPVPSCNIITSRFGNRAQPTAGASTYHGGLDIGAGQGSAIVAAEAGEVILASPNGGYGNCVMISHGNGIVTLYGHMDSFAVSYGQTVSKGQTIGYVGSTGIVTGPHCHFEIRINGAQTDPAPYFSGLVYYC